MTQNYKSEIIDGIEFRTYKIAFKPSYILVPNPHLPYGDIHSFIPMSALPYNQHIKSYRFHLSEEAINLLKLQDPTIDHTYGYCKLVVTFDTLSSDYASLEVTRGIIN